MKYAVYGTLRKGQGIDLAHMLERDNIEYTFLGEARIPGRMYDLGPFPCLVRETDEDKATTVVVEVFEVKDPIKARRVLATLDMIEGYPGHYDRELVDTDHGQAYVYVYRDKPYMYESIVADGDWTAHRKRIGGYVRKRYRKQKNAHGVYE